MIKRLAIALLILGACRTVTSPLDTLVTEGAVQFTPPAHYRELWQAMEACSGLRGDFDAVRWYRAPYISYQGQNYDAAWVGGSTNAIVITSARLDNTIVIDHEITHALFRGEGHPPQYFNGACGDLTTVRENPSP